jgi:hypothetical protein
VLEVLRHLLWALSVAALAGAALRVASLSVPGGLVRVVAAAVIAVATAIVQALALGLVGLGSSPPALAASAVATWIVVRAATPRPELAATAELAA